MRVVNLNRNFWARAAGVEVNSKSYYNYRAAKNVKGLNKVFVSFLKELKPTDIKYMHKRIAIIGGPLKGARIENIYAGIFNLYEAVTLKNLIKAFNANKNRKMHVFVADKISYEPWRKHVEKTSGVKLTYTSVDNYLADEFSLKLIVFKAA